MGTAQMIVLAFDSSADLLSIAVLRHGEPLAERSWRAVRPQGGSLLPAIEQVLADARVELREAGLIAVATGPGSFNGIRAGIAVAEGLSLALGVPVAGVPTLDALSYAHAGHARVVRALLPAGRGEYYGASYGGDWQAWTRLGPFEVAPLADHVSALPEGALLCGRLPDEAVGLCAERGVAVAPAFSGAARATHVGALAMARSGQRDFDGRASLQPVYVRRPGITQPTRAGVWNN